MNLIFFSGLPGVGKLTIAKELKNLTGFKLFHNHLTVDLLLSVFEFGSPAFVELRESIWLSVFEQACRSSLSGLIFTFNAENSVRQSFITKTQDLMASESGEIRFIEVVCPEAELRNRLDSPSRREHKKLTSWSQYQQLKSAGVFDSPVLPAPALVLDSCELDPVLAARKVVDSFRF
jgi:hypothetical protein